MALKNILLKVVGDSDDAKRKLGEVVEDLRVVGNTTAEARVEIQTQAAQIKLDRLKQKLAQLSAQEATPRVTIAMARTVEQIDRLEAKLEALDHKRVEVKVDVDRSLLSRVQSGIRDAVSSASGGLGSGSLGFGAVGNSLLILLPLLAALGPALASAAIGAFALAAAFAAVLGPAVLVAVAGISRLVAIFGALHQQHQQAASSAAAVASSQDQIRSATEQLANAQSNLRDQTVAANRAWQDSLEAVKDDLRDVAHAEEGITESHLALRRASLELKQLRSELGAGGAGLDDLFKKATDVSFHGDVSSLVKKGTQGKLSDEDELRLEEAIQAVREARLREKDAVDAVHDSEVKLARDRQTAGDFAKHGLAAYGPYRQAVQSVADAQHQLARAQDANAKAIAAQTSALDKLSPIERRVARVLDDIKDKVKQAFGPAATAFITGFADGLQTATKPLGSKLLVLGLLAIGKAFGDTFRAIGRAVARPEMQAALLAFTLTAARLVRIFGTRVFVDLLLILTRIAVAALPALVRGAEKVADLFDRWERGSRNTQKLKESIQDGIKSLKDFIAGVVDVVNAVIAIGKVLKFFGDLVVEGGKRVGAVFTFIQKHPWIQVLLAALLGLVAFFAGGELVGFILAIWKALGLVQKVIVLLAVIGVAPFGAIADAAKTTAHAVSKAFNTLIGAARAVGHGIARGFAFAIDAVRTIAKTILSIWKFELGLVVDVAKTVFGAVKDFLTGFIDTAASIGRRIGRALRNAVSSAVHGIGAVIVGVLNLIIGVINTAIDGINKITRPRDLGPLGHTPGFKLGHIDPIRLAAGGIAVRDTLARIGEAGKEAVIPLKDAVLAKLGSAIAAAAPLPAIAAGGEGMHIENLHVHVHSPAGRAPDMDAAAVQIEKALRARSRG
jgi:hypothetical protein